MVVYCHLKIDFLIKGFFPVFFDFLEFTISCLLA